MDCGESMRRPGNRTDRDAESLLRDAGGSRADEIRPVVTPAAAHRRNIRNESRLIGSGSDTLPWGEVKAEPLAAPRAN